MRKLLSIVSVILLSACGAPSHELPGGLPDGSFKTGGGPSSDPTAVTYSNVQTRLFDQYCVKCHSGAKPKHKIDLSSYEALMKSPHAGLVVKGDAAKSLIYEAIIKGKMPPKGATVDASATKLLADWINAGALNN